MGAADLAHVPPALRDVAEAARTCRACPLWRDATQTVFGEGADGPDLVLVGEQPGDQEDRAGRPFVGPAGRMLDRAMDEAGIDQSRTYVTNAVKHFKWTPRGKRRIHAKPSVAETLACRPWLEAELERLAPEVLVVLGATALRSVLGPGHTIGALRGQVLDDGPAPATIVTVHPSSILRGEPSQRDAALAAFVADLRIAAGLLPAA